jgi:hypothetical protein
MRVPESRSYTHLSCRAETVVSGPEFRAMSDPLADMTRTWCCECEDFFGVDQFAWSDTGEVIAQYYVRHARLATPTDRMLASRTGLLAVAGAGLLLGICLGVVVGWLTGFLVGLIGAVVLGLAGAVGGAMLHTMVLAPRVLQRICGVNDSRLLR